MLNTSNAGIKALGDLNEALVKVEQKVKETFQNTLEPIWRFHALLQ
jgi:hypothetical protein